MTIEHPEKIGLGTWPVDDTGRALEDVERIGFDWYYTWGEQALPLSNTASASSSFVAMIWDESSVDPDAFARLRSSGATTLLGFNEPDHREQADMTVAQALDLWPELEATGLRLGSPATTRWEVLGPNSWQGQFMNGAEIRGLDIDFIAVHYYSATGDVDAFKSWLEAVHQQYGKPLWVTEWALADWRDLGRFTHAQQAAFARAGAEMMDDLDFVERHAWFSAYDGLGNVDINNGLVRDDGSLTLIGQVFVELNAPTPQILGGTGPENLIGGSRSEFMQGFEGNDVLWSDAGYDTLKGDVGDDLLDGGAHRDRMEGGLGNDTFIVDDKEDVVVELPSEGTDHVRSSVSHVLAANVENVTLIGAADLTATGNELANRVVGNAAANILRGDAGDDILEGEVGGDTLFGGAGFDRLGGGQGHDVYVVDDAGDVVVEEAGQGWDQVQASTSVALTDEVEGLLLTGAAPLSGTGSRQHNRIVGNPGANSLFGLSGDDQVSGAEDADWLDGGQGRDWLDGGAGDDTLTGGAGSDLFVFSSGRDRIIDFEDSEDTIYIDDAVWGGAPMTKAELLRLAVIVDDAVMFSFPNGQTLRIEGVTSLAALADDIVII